MTHYFPEATRQLVSRNLADYFSHTSGSIDGVLEEINRSLDNIGYGWREALDSELFRWPHELESAEETFCSERALWFYAHTQLAGLNPQYHILENYGGADYHHEVVTVERDGETVLLDWHGPHKGKWDSNSFVAVGDDGKEYKYATHSKRHKIPHDVVLSRVHELRSGAYFRRALQVPQILHREQKKWGEGRIDFTLQHEARTDGLLFTGSYRNSVFGFDIEYQVFFSQAGGAQEGISLVFDPKNKYTLFSSRSKTSNQLKKIRGKMRRPTAFPPGLLPAAYPSANLGGIQNLKGNEDHFFEALAAVDYIHWGEDNLVHETSDVLTYLNFVLDLVKRQDNENATVEDRLASHLIYYPIPDDENIKFERVYRRLDFLLAKRMMRMSGVSDSCERMIENNAHPALLMAMNGNRTAAVLWQLTRPLSEFFHAEQITGVYNRALHIVNQNIGCPTAAFSSDPRRLAEDLPALHKLCYINRAFHNNATGMGQQVDHSFDQVAEHIQLITAPSLLGLK